MSVRGKLPSRRGGGARDADAAASWPGSAQVAALARQLRGWTDSVLGVAGPATDMAFGLAAARATEPAGKAAIAKAGGVLRRMRESAGMTLDEVARAVDLSDPGLLAAAEGGKAALPFEVVLRLGSVLGRSDPLTAVMKLARAYNPELWKTLDELGVGKIIVQAGRERELANVYRANDAARALSDEDFAAVLGFTRRAFDMAVEFRLPAQRKPGASTTGRRRSS